MIIGFLKKILPISTLPKSEGLTRHELATEISTIAKEDLAKWIKDHQLFSDTVLEKYTHIIMVYTTNCSPQNATLEEVKLASKYLAIYFYLNDQNQKNPKYREFLENIIKAFDETPVETQSNGVNAVRDFMVSLKSKVAKQDLFVFEPSVKLMLASFLREHEIALGHPLNLKEFRELRKKTIAVTPYVELWSAMKEYNSHLSGPNSQLNGLLDKEPLLHKAIRVISLSNDLHSVAEDIAKGKPNEVLIYREEMAVLLKDAYEAITIEFERESFEVMDALQKAKKGGSSEITQFCELLEICISGNIKSMKILRDRYSSTIDFEQLEDKLPKLDGVMGMFQQLRIGRLTKLELAHRALNGECKFQGVYVGRVARSKEMNSSVEAPPEIFTSMLILDVAPQRLDPLIKTGVTQWLLGQKTQSGTFNFFANSASPSLIPDDVDCTSVGMTALLKNGYPIENAQTVASTIINNTNEEGIIQVYLPPRKSRENRIDVAVCANALTLLHQLGRQDEAQKTEEYLFEFLQSGIKATRYYESPFVVLYFINRFISANTTSDATKARFLPLLKTAFESLSPSRSSALELATHIIVGKSFKTDIRQEQKYLTSLLGEDNLWACEPFYRCGQTSTYFGSRSITSAFALEALSS